ncbi:MAG: methylenetetrahydrofolate reductase [NAD(P)H] [Chloroflexi bacterium]|nr:MAG: methylenetetrahydrofolate reductase [NAD(P)H] [Chloroflexota bacterium]TMF25696.1 MAG: methylenetetrahydrofolate reductase [NAD(P)H] [Chloroflexota bacterium]TMF97173.1 MAG: methylenetetrahydrofolate reductase [NAD(P)H] [Chloroflexota bacterium]
MRIAEMLTRSKPTISFEFMAPRNESEVDVLEQTVSTLAGHAPDWVSVTYRVRTGDKTLELVTRIKRQYHIEAMAHLTCANSADRTRQILNWMEREGVANVLALRGDDPAAGQRFVPADPQLAHASDLITLVKRSGYRFGVGAACSAEKHPESPTLDHEMRYMRLKVECGADFLITQLFMDNAFYFDLVRRARDEGITVPIVPGLMPIASRRSLGVMTAMSGASVPAALQAAIDEAPDDEAIRALGVRHCIAQCAELLEAGVPGLHFYTFNRARAPIEILEALRGQQLLAS